MKKPKETKPCPMPNCWQTIPSSRHFCNACTSWWHRISIKNPAELSFYVQRMGRFAGRFTRIHSLKKKKAA